MKVDFNPDGTPVPLEVYRLRTQLAQFINQHYKKEIEIDWDNWAEKEDYINLSWDEIQEFDRRSKTVLYNNMLGFITSTECQDAILDYVTRRIPVDHNLGTAESNV